MDEQEVKKTGYSRGLIVGLAVAFTVVVVFSFGMFVGEQKARFSYRWGRNYHEAFGGPPIGMGRPQGFFGGHGADGMVVDKGPNRLVLRGRDNAEKIILIDRRTFIVKGRAKIGLKDIKERNAAVVMGSPDKKGRIKARLIRIFAPGQWEESMWERDGSKPPPPLPL